MTRIRHILPAFGRVPRDLLADSMSGIVRSALTIAAGQSRSRGHRVELLGLNRDQPSDHFQLGGVKLWATRGLSVGKWDSIDWRYFLPIYLRSFRSPVDILHVHDSPFLLAGPRAARRILHFHTPVSPRLSTPFVSNCLKADRVICNSGYMRDDFLRNVPYPPEKTAVVHNAVDLGVFGGGNPDTLRRTLRISAETRILLFVGQLSWQKGLIHLLKALPGVEGDIVLVVAGGRDLWQTIDDPTDRLAVKETEYEKELRHAAIGLPVHFLGTVPTGELKHIYAACDVFVCPSEWQEPFGMVNVEAMAVGKAVVASRVGGIPEIVCEGETGFLVQSADPMALAASINKLLSDDDLRTSMGRAGYLRARDHFNWDRALTEIDDVYDDAI